MVVCAPMWRTEYGVPAVAEDKIVDVDPEKHEKAPARPSRLRDAMQKARLSEAERSDVIIDLREAEIARLELLQDALADVFDELPPENDLLECAMIPGNPPRLWIDVLAYVVMGRDKRTYRFVMDSRYGRQVILETVNLEEMSQRITDYVAHRILERERALEADDRYRTVSGEEETGPAEEDEAPVARAGLGWGSVVTGFLIGVLVGAAGLFSLGLLLVSS